MASLTHPGFDLLYDRFPTGLLEVADVAFFISEGAFRDVRPIVGCWGGWLKFGGDA